MALIFDKRTLQKLYLDKANGSKYSLYEYSYLLLFDKSAFWAFVSCFFPFLTLLDEYINRISY